MDKMMNNMPQGGNQDDGRPMKDAGCMTGVEDTYGTGSSALNSGMPECTKITGKNLRGDGMQER